MNFLLLILSISVSFATPLKKMEENLKVYHGSQALECNSEASDNGLFADVSCSIVCKNSSEKRIERVKGVFSPESEGLRPGNGSDNSHIVWASLGIALKNWSSRVCLEKAIILCKSISEIESYSLAEIESGDWKLKSFPGCHEKKITSSPFDEKVKSNKISNPMLKLSHFSQGKKNNFEYLYNDLISDDQAKDKESCSNPIIGKVCYGDCVDLNAKEISETIATPEPLGSEVIKICGDQLKTKLRNLNLSAAVKREICESFFWNSLMKSEMMIKTCAALRGEITCPEL